MKYWLRSAAYWLEYPCHKKELEDLAQLGFTLIPRNAQWQEVAIDSPEVTHMKIAPPAKPVTIRSLTELTERLGIALVVENMRPAYNQPKVKGEFQLTIYNDYLERHANHWYETSKSEHF